MRYQLLTLCTIVLLTGTLGTTVASASTITDSLARMDAIIKEMTSLRAEFAALTAAIPTSPAAVSSPQVGAVLGSTANSILTQKIELGETNSDIKKIQKLLATDKEIYPYGVSSGMFGPKTEEAVKNFQTRFGLKSVGAVGPATKALLEVFFAAYPDDIYPADVLKKKPTVLGASISVPAVTPVSVVTSVTTPATVSGSNTAARSISINKGDGEAKVKITYTDGTSKSIVVGGSTNTLIIEGIASRTTLTKAQILAAISVSSDESEDENEDEGDAAESSSDGEFKSITAAVADGSAVVKVRFSNGDKDSFDVEKDKEASIIKEVAKELDVEVADIEDVIEFSYEPVDEIAVDIKDGSALATVTFEDGTTKRIKVTSDNEKTIIKAIAKELDEDIDDVDDWTSFDTI